MAEWDFSAHEIPLIGTLFKDPTQENLRNQMDQAASTYAAMRPELAQSQMNALGNMASMFTPYNRSMDMFYGPGSAIDFSQALQSPLTSGMAGQTAFGPYAPKAAPMQAQTGPMQQPRPQITIQMPTQQAGVGGPEAVTPAPPPQPQFAPPPMPQQPDQEPAPPQPEQDPKRLRAGEL